MNGIFLFFAVTGTFSSKPESKDVRVIDGVDDIHNEFPYVVAICEFHSYKFFRECTGSLITKDWVLTAGHCIKPSSTIIQYGDMTIYPGTETAENSKILKGIQHPNYKFFQYGTVKDAIVVNDIGLLLVEEVTLKTLGKVSAADYMTMIGYPVRFSGVGATFRDNATFNQKVSIQYEDQLRRRQIGEAALMKCKKVEKHIVGPSICLAPKCAKKDQRATYGDSGGPVTHSKKIVGVCSCGGHRNGLEELRYTPVSPYLDWMQEVISKERVISSPNG